MAWRRIMKSILILLAISLIYSIAGYSIALLVSILFKLPIKDVVFCEGLLVLLSSLYFSIKGNPSGIGLSALGSRNAQYIAYTNLEVTRMERESTNYYKNFTQHSVLSLSESIIPIIIGSILLIILSLLILK